MMPRPTTTVGIRNGTGDGVEASKGGYRNHGALPIQGTEFFVETAVPTKTWTHLINAA